MKTISIAAGCAALVAVGVYAFPALTADRKGAADKAPEVQKLAPSAPKSLPSVPQSMGQVQLSFAPVVKRVAPAVVNVYSKTIVQAQANPFFNDPLFGQLFGTPEMRQRVQQSLGSGVIVRADGVIITNNHVAEGGSEIVTRFRLAFHDCVAYSSSRAASAIAFAVLPFLVSVAWKA